MEKLYIVVMGDGGVGKTAVVNQFVRKTFVETYDPTIEDMYRKHFTLEDVIYDLDILDTAGTEYFKTMKDLYIKRGDGAIFMFSVLSISTFEYVKSLHERVANIRGEHFPIVLAGNKTDLSYHRTVSVEDAMILARSYECPYIEISAKENVNIDRLFGMLIHEIIAANPSTESDEREQVKKKCRLSRKCSLF